MDAMTLEAIDRGITQLTKWLADAGITMSDVQMVNDKYFFMVLAADGSIQDNWCCYVKDGDAHRQVNLGAWPV